MYYYSSHPPLKGLLDHGKESQTSFCLLAIIYLYMCIWMQQYSSLSCPREQGDSQDKAPKANHSLDQKFKLSATTLPRLLHNNSPKYHTEITYIMSKTVASISLVTRR